MKAPLSWIKDFVDVDSTVEELAQSLTLAGLEVEGIKYVGLPMPGGKAEGRSGGHTRAETKTSGIEWDPEKIVVGEILEVIPHPNADRLVLCRINEGKETHIVLTGAPNLFSYKQKGILERSIKVAYAKEGAILFDGHQPGQELMKIKRTKIRGVESYSMACSEKELGISDEHEGIIILDDDAVPGTPLVDYMGDAVLEIDITPNIARNANIYGIAREISAITGKELRKPDLEIQMEGNPLSGRANIHIEEPDLNPRFVLGLIESVNIMPSPYKIQRRLKLTGMRPINNIVDATNYAMIELGEPLHAFDYDALLERSGGKPPTISTRRARPGEKLVTLDEIERKLDEFTVLVCDTEGALSIAGVMGGGETEVTEDTRNVLLEGASWNFINIRKTLSAQKISSEASYRFSRGVHPSLAKMGVERGLELMRRWSGGVVAVGLLDSHTEIQLDTGKLTAKGQPITVTVPVKVQFTEHDVERWLGIKLSSEEIKGLLVPLEFEVPEVDGDLITVLTPQHRLDIGEGITGVADIMEEIARVYGYDRIPSTRMASSLPPQRANRDLKIEERIRDLLVNMGVQEVMTYRITSPEMESRILPEEIRSDKPLYIELDNPIVSDRSVMRRSLLASLFEVLERNARIRNRISVFEIGPVFIPGEGELPEERALLALVTAGNSHSGGWNDQELAPMNFFDLKGMLEYLFSELRIGEVTFKPIQHPTFHPGKCAGVYLEETRLGVIGELNPLVVKNYKFPDTPISACEIELDILLKACPDNFEIVPVSQYPPVLEDLAVIVDDGIPAAKVMEVIRSGGGKYLVGVELFDLYRGDQIRSGEKSLAFRLTYQAEDKTLTDDEVSKLRNKIIRRLDQELKARLRS